MCTNCGRLLLIERHPVATVKGNAARDKKKRRQRMRQSVPADGNGGSKSLNDVAALWRSKLRRRNQNDQTTSDQETIGLPLP